MPRSVNSTILTALLADEVKLFYAVDLDFYNGSTSTAAPVYFWTGVGDLSANSNTYVGAGDLLQISGIEEASELKASGINLTLTGVPPSLVTAALSHEYHGRLCKVYFGVQGNSNLTEIFSGYMDQLNIKDSGESSTIEVKVESKLVDLDRMRPFRYTEEIQQSLYSGDTFFSFVQDLQDKKLNWGEGITKKEQEASQR